MYLVPVNGSDSDWYKNVLNEPGDSPSRRRSAGDGEGDSRYGSGQSR